MAYINVHDKVLGPKLRKLAKALDCSQNEALGLLVRMWLWGMDEANSDGSLKCADKADIEETLTIGLARSIETADMVPALIESEWLEYEDGTYYIHDWEDWQKPLCQLNEIRENNNRRQREYRERKRAIFQTSQESKPDQEVVQKAPEVPKKKALYTTDFEKFWSAYPRKVGKGEAYKKYKARVNDGFREDDLYEAAMNYANQCIRDHTEEKYIKHAKTFLSDTMPFADYIHRERRPQEAGIIPEDGANPFRR